MVLIELHPAINTLPKKILSVNQSSKREKNQQVWIQLVHLENTQTLNWIGPFFCLLWIASLSISITLRWGQTPFFFPSSQSLEWVSAKMGSCWSDSHILVTKGIEPCSQIFFVLKGIEHKSGLKNITSCFEHLVNLTTHHLDKSSSSVTSWILLPSNIFDPYLHIPGHWLIESHNSHSSYYDVP